MKIVVINGQPRAGKDEFVKFCQKHTTLCYNLSTVDFVKEVAAFAGWDGQKTPKNREFLSDLKDLLTQWNDVPFKSIQQKIEKIKGEMRIYDFNPEKDGIVFIHCREPKEIQRFVYEMGALTLLIRRNSIETDNQSNHADADVFNYNYDFAIENNGTLEELEEKAISFLKHIGITDLKN